MSVQGSRWLNLDNLPDDVLFAIFFYLDVRSLLAVACVNHSLHRVASDDTVWRRIGLECVNIRITDKRFDVSWKELCRVSWNWTRGRSKDRCLLKFRSNFMPWISLGAGQGLFSSQGSDLVLYQNHKRTKTLSLWKQRMVFRGHQEDICRFVVHGTQLLSSSMDKTIRIWNVQSGKCDAILHGHVDGVHDVDGWGDIIVSGSRDKTIKIWSQHAKSCLHTVNTQDRVWCVRLNPALRATICGTGGHCNMVPPLQLWDLESGRLLCYLTSEQYRPGAGVFSVKWESPFTMLSAGYDTYVRLWDVRLSKGPSCVLKWEDPHDSAVYCVESDCRWMFASGTNRYGVVRLWDKRMSRSMRSFFAGRQSHSPVYSVRFNRTTLFVALAQGIRALDFAN